MRKLFSNIALALAFTGLGLGSASALDLGEIELGKAYEIPAFSSVTGTITAPSTGILYQYGGSAFDYNGVSPTSAGYCDNGQLWSIEVEEGVTYTVENSFLWNSGNDGTITWNMQGASAFEFKECNPVEGTMVTPSVNGTGDIMITMSEPWRFTTAHLECGAVVSSDIVFTASSSLTQGVRINEQMKAFYADGTFDKAGNTPFILIVNGVQNEGGTLYNEDGIIKLQYIAGPLGIDLVETNVVTGDNFLSYYRPGDEAGIFYFTFDGELSTTSVPQLEISAGNQEVDGSYFYEVYNGVVDGATVSFDLTGENRATAFARCGIEEGSMVGIKLKNVYDASGAMAQGGSVSTPGGYSFTFYYYIVPEQLITYEFTPSNGSFLTEADNTLNLWMSGTESIVSYDGIWFVYGDGSIDKIPADELVNVATREGELEFNVTIPARAKTDPVTVSLYNIVSNDGYNKTVKATYNQLVVLWSTPIAEGKDCSMLPASEQIRIRTNLKEADFPKIDTISLLISSDVLDFTAYNMSSRSEDPTLFEADMTREEGQDGYFVCDGPTSDILFLEEVGEYYAYFFGDPWWTGFTFYGATVSSIDSVVAEKADNSYDVYRLNGSVVMLKADKAALSTLAPGFYIVNGTKIYLR